CGEGGAELSGGERQRIAIARSLLRRASVLLVDEATAALDAENAYQVSSDLLNLPDVTRIVVTHSLERSLLLRYDQILVMKDGAVVETGTFDALMAQKGLFYALYTVAQ
ncbi:MAG: ATP-binding cassette domain-containing protein, partial [Clostridiales bacterium]|nr:ATP-binding cassette domain-containing protein [Clostridiales bacterium]